MTAAAPDNASSADDLLGISSPDREAYVSGTTGDVLAAITNKDSESKVFSGVGIAEVVPQAIDDSS